MSFHIASPHLSTCYNSSMNRLIDQEPPRGQETSPQFERRLRAAYDPSSCGMGQLMLSLKLSKTTPFASLPRWALSAITSSGSNYIQDATIGTWGFSFSQEEKYRSPILSNSVRLLGQMDAMYDKLNWAVERDALEQLTGISSTGDKTQPISDKELKEYLEEADKRGLIKRFRSGEGKEISALIAELGPSFADQYSPGELRNRLIRIGVSFSPDLVDKRQAIAWSSAYQREYIQAATYKLAIQLGYTEQLLYAARALGEPISPNFIPQTSDAYPALWEKDFGEEMPPIEQLYRRSLEVLKELAGTENPNPNLAPFLALQPNFN